MWAVLAFIILLYAKKTTLTQVDWYVVFIPVYIIALCISIIIYNFYCSLRSSHEKIFLRLRSHLLISVLLLFIFIYEFSFYLERHEESRLKLFLALLPLYIVFLSVFGLFLYLLPGMCDPELNNSRKMPFLILLYFIICLLGIVFVNVNGMSILYKASGYIIFYPIFFALIVHLLMIYNYQNSSSTNETILVVAFIMEAIIV